MSPTGDVRPHSTAADPSFLQRFHILVETDDCFDALPRILGLIAQKGYPVAALAMTRDQNAYWVDVHLDAASEMQMESLCAKIESIISVGAVAVETIN